MKSIAVSCTFSCSSDVHVTDNMFYLTSLFKVVAEIGATVLRVKLDLRQIPLLSMLL